MRQCERTRQLYGHRQWQVWRPNGLADSSGTETQLKTVQSSFLEDTTGRQNQNPVNHLKYRYENFSFNFPKARDSVSGYYRQSFYTNLWAWSTSSIPTYGGPCRCDWKSILSDLMRDATGAMPLSANLVVNAIEFASLKSLIPQACEIAGKIIKKGLGKKSLKEMANGHLLYSFGVKPLITDIKGILAVRQAVEKRIAELLRRNGSTHRISVRGAEVFEERAFPWNINGSNPSWHLDGTGHWYVQTKPVLSADVTSFFVNDASSQIKLWSSALGLSTPLSTIWEIIPFSFVADWLLPIGDNFSRVEDKLGMHETVRSCDVSNVVWSRKTVARCPSFPVICGSSYYSGWNGLKGRTGEIGISHYERGLGIPASDLIPPIGWSANRTALSISLFLQKVL